MNKYKPESENDLNTENGIRTRYFLPGGTLLFGRAMLAQLPHELDLIGAVSPVMLCARENRRRAVKAAALTGLKYRVSTGKIPEGCDCLMLAGSRSFIERYADDPRARIWITLSEEDLLSFEKPLTDFIVADTALIGRGESAEQFLEKYALAISDGLAGHPGGIKVPSAFVYSNRTMVFYGNGAVMKLSYRLDEMAVKHPLILTDKGIRAAGLLKNVEDVLEAYDLMIFDDIPADSSSETVNAISRIYREHGRDGIIAFGGGSVLDTGKGVYMNISLGGEDLGSYAGSNRLPEMHTPFIAVPTTSGTGSEVTKVAVVRDTERERKILYVSPKLQPDFAILDSRLTTALPPHLTSITGMDALSHAVEAYTCLGKNPVSDQMAWKAIELIRDSLIPVMSSPEDTELRLNLALASCLAGQAFSNSMVGMVHTIGHSVGAVCHAPHGSCMAVLLPAALEYNYPEIRILLEELLPAVAGPDAAESVPPDERARAAIEAVRRMNSQLKELTGGRHPCGLGDITGRDGNPLVKRSDFKLIAETSLGDASIVYNPVELRLPDIHQVLEQSY